MNISKTMLLNFLTLAVTILALPQLLAIIGEDKMPFVACAAGILGILIQWINQSFGVFSIWSIATLLAGVLSVPELVAILPVQYVTIITLIGSVLNLLTRANSATPPLQYLLVKPAVVK